MKNISLLIILCVFPLSFYGQTMERFNENLPENREEIAAKFGERLMESKKRLLSPAVQGFLMKGDAAETDYTMKTDSVIYCFWNANTESWDYDYKHGFEYNEDWQGKMLFGKEFIAPHVWQTSMRKELTYNEAGQVTLIEHYAAHNERDANLELSTEIEVTYDDSGWIDYLEIHDYDSGSEYIMEYEFLEEERLEKIETLVYLPDEDEWQLEQTIQFTYDDAGRRLKTEVYLDLGAPIGEVLIQKVEYEFNEEGLLKGSIESEFDLDAMELLPVAKREVVYDDDEMIPEHVLEYSREGNDWQLAYKEVITYDHGVLASEVAYPFDQIHMLFEWEFDADLSIDFQDMPVEFALYKYEDGDFHKYYLASYYFSTTDPDETGLEPLSEKVTAYPNPFHNTVTVTNAEGLKKITLINLLGQPVIEKETLGLPEKVITTESLPPGAYFLILEGTGGAAGVLKLIKE